MTQKTKKWKQFLTFTILAGFLFYSCQYEDEVMLQNSNINQLLLHRDVEKSIVKVSELFKNDNFKKSFEKIRKIKTKNTPFDINSRSAMEDQYGSTITNPDATVPYNFQYSILYVAYHTRRRYK